MSKIDLYKEVQITLTIANGASLSDAADFAAYGGSLSPAQIILPASLEGTVLSFQVSKDGTTYGNLYDMAGEVTCAVVASSVMVQLTPDKFRGWKYIKVRTGAAGSAQNQTGAATIIVVGRVL